MCIMCFDWHAHHSGQLMVFSIILHTRPALQILLLFLCAYMLTSLYKCQIEYQYQVLNTSERHCGI